MHDAFPSRDPALPADAEQATDALQADLALAHYESAMARGASDPATLGNYGVLLWRHYEFHRGGEVFARVVADPRSDTDTLRRIAHCYFEIGRFTQAADVMRVAVVRQKEPDAATTNTLAWTLERDHQTLEARHYAEAAHALDRSYSPAVRLLAHLDERAGDNQRAAARITEQLRQYPGPMDWTLRYELAAVFDSLGRHDAAWAELCRAKLQLAPETASHLNDSHFIRRRQWEMTQSVTAADLRRWRQAETALQPPRRIAFLAGFPRSGTTLLEQIVASHGDAIETDESGILPRQFLEPLIWKAEDSISAIIELRSFEADQLLAGRETFYRLTENYLGHPVAGRLLIEKNPMLTADLPLVLRLFPEARLLIAIRDPRDVVLSYLFTMIPLNWSSAPATNVVEACRFYAETMRHWLWWRTRLQWPAYEARYERLIADPRGETERLAEFLGLPWNAAMLDEGHRSERRAVRTPTYIDVTKPLYTRAIGRWKNYRQYLEPGLEILKPFVEIFGYEG